MPTFPTSDESAGAACGVAAHALVEATLADLPRLREAAAPPGSGPLPQRFLRHADEQTVVGMRAVLEAIAAHGAGRRAGTSTDAAHDFSAYGVVSAACQPGRIAAAHSFAMFGSGGPVTVSPHIVPQCSLHSIAGAVSVALGMHGPHIGTSGGPEALGEGLLASLTLLHTCSAVTQHTPGIWFVATAWDGEPALDREGRPQERTFDPPICVAVAAALTASTSAPAAATRDRLVLRVAPGRVAARQSQKAARPADDIRRFAAALAACDASADAAMRWSHALAGTGELRLAPAVAAARRREAA
jgi:hypothetical protein